MNITDEQARIIGQEIGKSLGSVLDLHLERMHRLETIPFAIVRGIKESVDVDGEKLLKTFLEGANRNRQLRSGAQDFADRMAEAVTKGVAGR